MNAAQRLRVLRRSGIFAFALVTFGCSAEPGPRVVMRRLSDPQLSDPAVPTRVDRVRLAEETRWARCVTPNSSFRIPIDAGVDQLQLSLGVRSPQPRSVHFSVNVEDGAEVFSGALDRHATDWRDEVVDLPASDVSRTLVFATHADLPSIDGATPLQTAPACWGSVALLGRSEISKPAPPNVILVSLDTLGAGYLSGFDHPRAESPRIDAFLQESYSFDRAFVQFGNTLISHRSIFTSTYPSNQPKYGPQTESLAEALSGRGYLTAAITENGYVGSAFGFARGFDRFTDGSDRVANSVLGHASGTFDRAIGWLEEFGRDARFFLFVHTYEVHEPYLPGDAESLAYANALTPDDTRTFPGRTQARRIVWHNSGEHPIDERDIRRLAALYQGEVHYLDGAWGRFLDRLEGLGLAEGTLVVLTSDHGEAFGEHGKLEHGKTLHNRVLHVPLAFRLPGRIEPARATYVVESVDIKPTVLGLAGLRVSGTHDGRDLSPLLRGETAELPQRPVFAEMNAQAGDGVCLGRAYAAQNERYKLVACTQPASESLFDLATDPSETRDASTENPEELQRLRAALSDYRARVGGQGVIVPHERATDVDDTTRERLRELGYLE